MRIERVWVVAGMSRGLPSFAVVWAALTPSAPVKSLIFRTCGGDPVSCGRNVIQAPVSSMSTQIAELPYRLCAEQPAARRPSTQSLVVRALAKGEEGWMAGRDCGLGVFDWDARTDGFRKLVGGRGTGGNGGNDEGPGGSKV